MNELKLDYLTENTRYVFEKLSTTKFIQDYTLVGGSALALQIGHRLSEDLDFVYYGEKLNINSIKRNISKIFPSYKILREDYDNQIDFVVNETRITFFCTEAVLIPFDVKDYSFRYKNINIATYKILASLKFSAISQRNTIRDYYDLYFLSKYFIELREIIEETKKFFPNISPIVYTETLVYTDDIPENDISGHLRPKEIVTKEEIAEFFRLELKKIYGK